MPKREADAFQLAAYDLLMKRLTKEGPVKLTRQEEATRLRVEQAAREQRQFVAPVTRALTDDDERFMSVDSPIDAKSELNPMVVDQLGQIGCSLTGLSIMEEIYMDEMSGKLRPFVEGEHIGKIQNHVRKPADPHMTRNEIMDERQRNLRARQKRNDATLAKLIKRNT